MDGEALGTLPGHESLRLEVKTILVAGTLTVTLWHQEEGSGRGQAETAEAHGWQPGASLHKSIIVSDPHHAASSLPPPAITDNRP